MENLDAINKIHLENKKRFSDGSSLLPIVIKDNRKYSDGVSPLPISVLKIYNCLHAQFLLILSFLICANLSAERKITNLLRKILNNNDCRYIDLKNEIAFEPQVSRSIMVDYTRKLQDVGLTVSLFHPTILLNGLITQNSVIKVSDSSDKLLLMLSNHMILRDKRVNMAVKNT